MSKRQLRTADVKIFAKQKTNKKIKIKFQKEKKDK